MVMIANINDGGFGHLNGPSSGGGGEYVSLKEQMQTDIQAWVGGDAERARILHQRFVVGPLTNELEPRARALIDNFVETVGAKHYPQGGAEMGAFPYSPE